MRGKLNLVSWLAALALVAGCGSARAADAQSAGNFKLVLSDGSTVKGATSFVIDLDTQYGTIKIPSTAVQSARFDASSDWAEIRLNDAELNLKYKPASSDIKASTSAGSLNIGLAKVLTIDNGSVPPPSAANPNAVASQGQANAAPPPAAYAQQQPPAATAPPTAVYQYPYQYVSPGPYYYYAPSYYYPPYYYWGGPYIGWPYFGIGVRIGPRFGFRIR
jgi:hypothetical protein